MVYFDVLTVTASKGSFSEGSDFSLVLHHRDLSQFALCVVLQQPKISLNVLQFPKVNKKYPLGGGNTALFPHKCKQPDWFGKLNLTATRN